MGLTDLIPGSGAIKFAGGALAGGSTVGVAVHGVHKYKEAKLEKRLGVVDPKRQERAKNRVAVLKHVAWSDGVLHDMERLFLYDHIVKCPDLQADKKIALMLEMSEVPTERRFFGLLPKHYKREDFVASDEEAAGFKAQLYSMANADNDIHELEREYIEMVVKACGL